MKRLTSLMLCLLLLFSMSIGASAEGDGAETPCTHSYGSWSSTADSHSRTCSACGNVETGTHGFGAWAPSGEGHARSCGTCGYSESGSHGWNEGSITTQPDCSHAGVKTFTCQQCSATRTEEVSATGTHSYQNGVRVDEKQHTLTCPGCNATLTEDHVWNAGVITTAATCKDTGVKTYTCTKCPATKTETLPKSTTHSYGEWDADEVNHTRSCSVCSHVDSGKHSWSTEGYVIKAATCKEEGILGFDCSGCDWTLTEAIKKTDHTYDHACDPDCNQCGETREVEHKFNTYRSYNSTSHWYACSKCKEKKDVAEHVPGPAATEQKAQTCLTCGYEMMPKKNHEHDYNKNKWESDESGHWHACKGCEVEIAFDEHDYSGDKCGSKCTVCGFVNPEAHTYDGTYEADKHNHWAICTECKGVSAVEEHIPGPEATIKSAQICTVCGYELVPMIQHTHQAGEWLTNDTEHWRDCDCGEKVDLALHDWDQGTENKDTTVTYRCVVCGESKTVGEPQEEGGFPWWIILVLLIICLIGAIGMLIYLLLVPKKTGKFSHS